MPDLYPVYFEVKAYEGENYYDEGGFIYAKDWDDAAKQIAAIYGTDLVSMTIEFLDSLDLIMSLTRARKIKEALNL